MCKKLALSVFVSQFDRIKEKLPTLYTQGDFIFTSLHIAEEFNTEYKSRCESMCAVLRDIGFTIIADVSKRTLDIFEETSIVALAKKLDISIIRFDFGFELDEIIAVAKEMPVCINASTLDDKTITKLKKSSAKVYAMHNYYPRPETGLDVCYFDTINENLLKNDIEVFAFIPGDEILRNPLQEGLPTLEKHRYTSPFSAFVDMAESHQVSAIFVGDGIISQNNYDYIQHYIKTGIVTLPIKMECDTIDLHDKVFSVRPDSPYRVMRLLESREYATKGRDVEPHNCVQRAVGSVTIDNKNYLRYSGEIQIVRENLCTDDRVNVIAHIPNEYHMVLPYCRQVRLLCVK